MVPDCWGRELRSEYLLDPVTQVLFWSGIVLLMIVLATITGGKNPRFERTTRRYNVVMYSGGKPAAEWTTEHFQLNDNHLWVDAHRIPQQIVVAGDYVLKLVGPASPQPDAPEPPRYIARLFNNGEVVATCEAVTHHVGKGWVILLTSNREQVVFGGNFVVEPIKANAVKPLETAVVDPLETTADDPTAGKTSE